MCHDDNENRGKDSEEWIELSNQECIRTFGEKENYKYLEILEADTIKQLDMEEKSEKST